MDCTHGERGRQASQANSTNARGEGAPEASGARRQTCAAAIIRTILLKRKTEIADASKAFGPFAVGGGCSPAPSLTPDYWTCWSRYELFRLARLSGVSLRSPADLAGACSDGKFVVSMVGEAYDARARRL